MLLVHRSYRREALPCLYEAATELVGAAAFAANLASHVDGAADAVG